MKTTKQTLNTACPSLHSSVSRPPQSPSKLSRRRMGLEPGKDQALTSLERSLGCQSPAPSSGHTDQGFQTQRGRLGSARFMPLLLGSHIYPAPWAESGVNKILSSAPDLQYFPDLDLEMRRYSLVLEMASWGVSMRRVRPLDEGPGRWTDKSLEHSLSHNPGCQKVQGEEGLAKLPPPQQWKWQRLMG